MGFIDRLSVGFIWFHLELLNSALKKRNAFFHDREIIVPHFKKTMQKILLQNILGFLCLSYVMGFFIHWPLGIHTMSSLL